MDLPLLLAGPILRRVEPGLVAVQVFLSAAATVRLDVYEGAVAFDTTNPVFVSSSDPPDPNAEPPRPNEATIRIGDRLHIAVVTARVPPASAKVLQPDFTYSYNLTITVGGTKTTLADLGLLTEHTVSGVTCEPLGYRDRILPSFALPPSTLDDLQIAYGSCRRPLYDDGDALAWLDEYQSERVSDPRSRVHQLFLGGDQIYADDVATIQMLRVAELGVELIGTDTSGVPLERVKVDRILARGPAPADPMDPLASYSPEPATDTATKGDLPAGLASFALGGPYPLVGRLGLTTRSAQFTSEDGDNHLISLGEFAATYLMAWSPACWGVAVPGAQKLNSIGAASGPPLAWLDTLADTEDVLFPPPVYPERVPQFLYDKKEKIAERAKKASQATPERRAKARRRSQRVHREFLRGLGKVQRVLANTPTYMILDDHDVTDDYFLNPLWRHRVLHTALGQSILTNAMIAYALFQDWGNDPRRYDLHTTAQHPELGGQLPGDLLDRATELFAAGRPGPADAAFTAIGHMFAHHLDNTPTGDGRFSAVRPPITWHFSIDGPKHRVVALDNRTRRSYVAEIGPPGNVSADALVDQLPLPPLAAGQEVLVVIAPLQVIGPPVLDEIVGRAIYRIFDMVSATELTDPELDTGSRHMPGTNPDALETWAFDPITYEHFLGRLAEHGRVVLLSGDVHNAASNLMSYWRGTDPRPARIAQFTSSGFKNVMPVYLQALDKSAMLLQELLRAKLGVERLGWTRHDADLVLLPGGRTEDDLVATTRAKFLRSPVLLPTWGWPDDNPEGADPPDEALKSHLNPAKPPDWRWRVKPLLDERPDGRRPPPIRPKPLDDAVIEAQLNDPSTAFAAMQAVAGRHQAALDRMRNTRQMMFRSNFGICRFETAATGGAITAIGEVYTSAVDPETQLPVMDAYMLHRAPLGPEEESPPGELRATVLSRVPIPEPQP